MRKARCASCRFRFVGVLAASSYSRVWKETGELALVSGQVTSVLASRPYDLRHAGVLQWLNSGVPAPEVAARAGHSDVLLKIYAKCVNGQEQKMNDRILKGLGEEGTPKADCGPHTTHTPAEAPE